jgi:hypothetical protein
MMQKMNEILDFIIPRFVVVAAFFDETATSSAVRIKNRFVTLFWLAPVCLVQQLNKQLYLLIHLTTTT